MNKATRKLTEGAMMVAIVGIILFINRQFGNMLEYLMYWILTFPILVYTAKYGIKDGLLPSISMLLLSFMIAAPTTIFYLFTCIVIGLVYGGGVRKRWKNGTLLIWSGIFTFFSYLITTILFAALFGYNPQDDIEMVKALLEILNINTGIDLMKMVGIIVLLVAILMSVLQTMCIHMIANILLSRLRIEVRPMKNILEITVPKWVGFIILIIWVLFWGRNVLKLNQEVSSVLLSVYLTTKVFALGYGVLTIMGVLLITGHRKLIFLILIAFFIPYVQDIIAALGIVDILYAIREKMKRGVIHGPFRKF